MHEKHLTLKQSSPTIRSYRGYACRVKYSIQESRDVLFRDEDKNNSPDVCFPVSLSDDWRQFLQELQRSCQAPIDEM